MKHRILKKSIIYRTIAASFGIVVAVLTVPISNFFIGFIIGCMSEIISLGIYYTFEYLWERHEMRLRKGKHVLILEDGSDKVKLAYNVLEVLDDNKFIIEVV